MKKQYSIQRLSTSVSAIATAVLLMQNYANASAPANLKAPDTEKLVMHLPAIGVQIYDCRIVDGKPAQWTFVAPEADLFEQPNMRLVGKHDAGPHWALMDGSKV